MLFLSLRSIAAQGYEDKNMTSVLKYGKKVFGFYKTDFLENEERLKSFVTIIL